MNGMLREVWACGRLELGEVRRSRWLVVAAVIYALVGAAFVLVGMRESLVMGFSGTGRALLSMVHTLLLLLPLLALAATGQTINRARDDGTLELLFSHPVRRGAYFVAVSLTRYVVLAVPLALLIVLMGVVGTLAFAEQVNWSFLVQTVLVSTALLVAFVGAGMAVSTFVRSQARAVIVTLVLWALAVCLLDFALIATMLRWRLNPEAVFLLASVNPVQAARMALLAGASTELSVLGPVGFYLQNQIGANALYALGLVWPVALGLTLWGLALQRFRGADIV